MLFLFFSIWVVIRPPFQSPDEFWHAARCYGASIPRWIEPDRYIAMTAGAYNPLLDFPLLHEISYRRAPGAAIGRVDVEEMRSMEWLRGNEHIEVPVTGIATYPPLYYFLVYVLGRSLTSLFDLSPYNSFYSYCLGSTFIAALAWSLVYRELAFELPARGIRRRIFLCLVLNPMTAFLSSSINPDALFMPLSALAAIYAYRSTTDRSSFGRLAVTCFTASLVKSSSHILIASLAVAVIVSAARKRARPVALAPLAAAFALGYALFHYWSPVELTTRSGAPASAPTAVEFAIIMARSLPGMIKEYWGSLGWLSFTLPRLLYHVLYALIAVNLAFLYRDRALIGEFHAFVFLVSISMALAVFAGQYVLYGQLGPVLQGRYFLPGALGFSLFLAHDRRFPAFLFIGYLGIFSALFIGRAIAFYYHGDPGLFLAALPYVRFS